MATVTAWDGTSISKGNGDTVTIPFTVIGPSTEAAAVSDFESNAPSTVLGLPRQSYTMNWVAQDTWHVDAIYKLQTNPQNQQEPGAVGTATGQITLSIGSETVHRTTSISTTKFPSNAKDYDNAIGVSMEGGNYSVAGCDVIVPVVNLRYTVYYTPASLTSTYRNTVIGLIGKTNDDVFGGFAAGEVLFRGAEFPLSDGEKIAATYDFGISKNETGLTVGGITNVDKKGWEYLWVKYKPEVDANALVTIAEAAYSEKVYEDGDFSALQLVGF